MHSNVLDLLNTRHASRAIATRPVPREVIDELLEAARLAPSCFNNQPWRFLFMTGEDALAKGRETLTRGNAAWAARAPLLVLAYARKSDDCTMKDGRAYYQFDLGLAVMNMMLMATERGLTARPMAGFGPPKIREAFGLEADDEPVVLIAVGYPDEDESHLPDEKRGMGLKPRARKAASEIMSVA